MLSAVLIIVVFLVLAGLMMSRKLPALLALPLMALAIGLIAGLSAGLPWLAPPLPPGGDPKQVRSLYQFLFEVILTDGAARLAKPIMFAIFGSVLSQVVMRQGIAQRIVRVAAEYAGDRKILLAVVMTAAIAVAFVSLTGLGAVIMIGSLALPIMIGAGLSPTLSACLMLFAISIGGVFNGANVGFYAELFKVDKSVVLTFALAIGSMLALTALAFILFESRRDGKRFAWALQEEPIVRKVPLAALFTPIIPILLMLPFTLNWPIIPAFLVGILWGLATTEPTRLIQNLTACFLEGLKDVSPVIGLFIGIGMTLNAMMDPTTSAIMAPFISAILPHSTLAYVLFFTLLAPLALYRGPFNAFGLGAGFASLVMASGALPPAAVMSAFLVVGQMQGICDPTNTHNVWIAQFTHGSTEDYLKRTIPYVWGFILIALIYAVLVRGVMG